MSKPKQFSDTREHLLATGEAIILGKSFSAVGLAEILGTAGVPKGSFYHYFRSKEGYGVELLRRYFEKYDGRLVEFLSKDAGSARDCLLHYFDGWLETHRCDKPQSCCLAVKLAAEVSDLSEPMREALADGMSFVVRNLAACIRRGQQEGSLVADLLPDETASALYSLWVGSALLFKTQHSRAPLLAAMAHTQQILRAP
jgi:TetR/AcrR family transcriptional repressor of nem operon